MQCTGKWKCVGKGTSVPPAFVALFKKQVTVPDAVQISNDGNCPEPHELEDEWAKIQILNKEICRMNATGQWHSICFA